MKVVILGSGTGVPERNRGCAGIYVNVAGEHITLDAGAGTARALAALGVTYLDLDRIFLTHFHPDHCLDLVSLLFAMRIPHPARKKPLTVYGPKGLLQLYRRLEKAFPGWINPKTYKLSLKEISEGSISFKGYKVSAERMKHSTRAIGYRIESQGKTLAYSGDTDFCKGAVRLGRNSDLFILSVLCLIK
jgi:ribonuclease BN (tRNA processing enzyme)